MLDLDFARSVLIGQVMANIDFTMQCNISEELGLEGNSASFSQIQEFVCDQIFDLNQAETIEWYKDSIATELPVRLSQGRDGLTLVM